ncbi:MAG: MbnP family protein [Flavobacteriia bacterium]|nr:T9SS type A sorting domain-containing protein [Cryomorphaceae bacterium]
MRILLFTLLFSSSLTWGQKNIFLHIDPLFGSQPFALNQTFTGNDGVAVSIEHFNYYLSDVKIFHDNGQQTNLLTDIWLITPTQHTLYLGYFAIQQIDSINFTIGVPKRYNTQTGALAQDISTYPEIHPLSFQSPSMYWGWSFGYMHMIAGGKADSNNDGVPNAYFELHNLGNNNQQSVTLPAIQTTSGNQIDLHYNCHVDRWFNQMPLSSVGVLHGETGLNLSVMQNVNTQDVFALNPAATIQENHNLFVSWKQTPTEITIHGIQNQGIENFQVFSNTGQKLLDVDVQNAVASFPLDRLSSGFYLVGVQGSHGQFQSFRIVKP